MKTGKSSRQAGFTYFGLLVAIATVALGAGAGAGILSNDLRRDKELDLLFAGDAIRRAIESYHAKNNGGVNPFPRQLEWLIRDPNQPTIQRHVRKIFRDPMHDPEETGPFRISETWVLIFNTEGQIVGVRSNSGDTPLKKSGFPQPYENFSQAKSYSDWRFIAAGAVPATAQTGAQPKNFIPTPLAPGGVLVPGANASPVAASARPPAPGPEIRPTIPAPSGSELPAVPRAPEPPPPSTVVAPTATPAASVAASEVAQPPAPPAAPNAPVTPAGPAATPPPTASPPPAPGAPSVAEPQPFGSGPQPFVIRAPKDF